jgi:hypothetical protein
LGSDSKANRAMQKFYSGTKKKIRVCPSSLTGGKPEANYKAKCLVREAYLAFPTLSWKWNN